MFRGRFHGFCGAIIRSRRHRTAALLPLRWFASHVPSTLSLSDRVRNLKRHCRGELALTSENGGAREEVASLHASIKKGDDACIEFDDLSSLCRVVAAAAYRPWDWLVDATAARCQASIAAQVALDTDSAARFALAACEAGSEREVGAQVVKALLASGYASAPVGTSAIGDGLSGDSCASLALAAAAAGLADAPLFEALLVRCSTRECDLTPANLGDLRLAASLAGPSVVGEMDVRASRFFRGVCSQALVDDPRGVPSATSGGNFAESLTDFEQEVSAALSIGELPHCRGAFLAGVFVPLAIFSKRCAVFAESVASFSVYANLPSQRTSFQQWKYRALVAAGWKVVVVSEDAWNSLTDTLERSRHIQELLKKPSLHDSHAAQ